MSHASDVITIYIVMGLQCTRVSDCSCYIMFQNFGLFAFLLNCKVSSLVLGVNSMIDTLLWIESRLVALILKL